MDVHVEPDQVVVFILLVCVFGVALRLLTRPRKKPLQLRDMTMGEEGRRLHVQRVSMERICDALLEAVIQGELTDQEANAEMAKLAKIYNKEELIPLIRSKKPRMLKANLQHSDTRRRLNRGQVDKVPIPEPEDVQGSSVEEETLTSILRRM